MHNFICLYTTQSTCCCKKSLAARGQVQLKNDFEQRNEEKNDEKKLDKNKNGNEA
jgi:hypothetical protein